MDSIISAPYFAVGLLVGMLICLELGRRLGAARMRREPQGAGSGASVVEGAVFGLFGLLIAFTFSGAASRFDARRELIAVEANDIGTAWLRLDLLADSARTELRTSFRAYLDSRLETYRSFPDLDAVKAGLMRSTVLQNQIWSRAVAATRMEGAHADATKLLLPALNAMIDTTTTRTMEARIHPPPVVFGLLFALALGAALLAGHAMAGSAGRSWLHIVALPATIAIAVYVILDLEYPRLGLFRIDAFDQVLVELRQSME